MRRLFVFLILFLSTVATQSVFAAFVEDLESGTVSENMEDLHQEIKNITGIEHLAAGQTSGLINNIFQYDTFVRTYKNLGGEMNSAEDLETKYIRICALFVNHNYGVIRFQQDHEESNYLVEHAAHADEEAPLVATSELPVNVRMSKHIQAFQESIKLRKWDRFYSEFSWDFHFHNYCYLPATKALQCIKGCFSCCPEWPEF